MAELIEVLQDQETEANRTVGSSIIVDYEEPELPETGVDVPVTKPPQRGEDNKQEPPQAKYKPPKATPIPWPKDPKIWFRLSHWGKETGKIDGYYRVFAFNMGRKLKYGWEISPKQKDITERLWKTALTKGFKS